MITIRHLDGTDIDSSEEIVPLRRQYEPDLALRDLVVELEMWDWYARHIMKELSDDERLVIKKERMDGPWMLVIYEGPSHELHHLFIVAKLYIAATDNGMKIYEESPVSPEARRYRPLHAGRPNLIAA